MQRSSRLLCRRTMRNSTQNFLLTIPSSSMSTSLKRRPNLNLLLQPGAQRERPAQRIGPRRLYQPAPTRTPTSCLGCPDPGGSPFQPAANGWRTLSFSAVTVEVLDLLVVLGFPVDEHAALAN